VISVQVLNELVSIARKTLRMPWPNVRAAGSAITELRPATVAVSMDVHETARRLAERDTTTSTTRSSSPTRSPSGARRPTPDLHTRHVIDGRVTIENTFHR